LPERVEVAEDVRNAAPVVFSGVTSDVYVFEPRLEKGKPVSERCMIPYRSRYDCSGESPTVTLESPNRGTVSRNVVSVGLGSTTGAGGETSSETSGVLGVGAACTGDFSCAGASRIVSGSTSASVTPARVRFLGFRSGSRSVCGAGAGSGTVGGSSGAGISGAGCLIMSLPSRPSLA